MLLTPLQFVVVATSIGALVWASYRALLALVRWLLGIESRRRMKRTREGGCLHCGYPIFPVQTRCPECGTAVTDRITAL
jgi:hypothetical protein